MEQIPLNHEASDGDTNKQTTASLPTEVVQCLENARFVSAEQIQGEGEGETGRERIKRD